jgi:hypothetical protein
LAIIVDDPPPVSIPTPAAFTPLKLFDVEEDAEAGVFRCLPVSTALGEPGPAPGLNNPRADALLSSSLNSDSLTSSNRSNTFLSSIAEDMGLPTSFKGSAWRDGIGDRWTEELVEVVTPTVSIVPVVNIVFILVPTTGDSNACVEVLERYRRPIIDPHERPEELPVRTEAADSVDKCIEDSFNSRRSSGTVRVTVKWEIVIVQNEQNENDQSHREKGRENNTEKGGMTRTTTTQS